MAVEPHQGQSLADLAPSVPRSHHHLAGASLDPPPPTAALRPDASTRGCGTPPLAPESVVMRAPYLRSGPVSLHHFDHQAGVVDHARCQSNAAFFSVSTFNVIKFTNDLSVYLSSEYDCGIIKYVPRAKINQ